MTVQDRSLPIHALHIPNSSSSSSSSNSNSNSNSNSLNPGYLLIAKSSILLILLAAILPLTLTPTTAGLANLTIPPINHTHNPSYHLKPALRTQPTHNLSSQTREPSTTASAATTAPRPSGSTTPYGTPRPHHLTRHSPTHTRRTRAPRALRTNPNNPATNLHPRLSNKPSPLPPLPRSCSRTHTPRSIPRAPRPNPKAPVACVLARIPILSLSAPSNSSSNKLALMPRRHSRCHSSPCSHNSHTPLLLLVTRRRRPRRPARCIRTRTRTRATCASVSLRATGQMC